MKHTILLLSGLFLLVLSSCKHSDETPAYDAGSADFSCFIAIGNSLTAGYANGSLYRSGQEQSFPAIMARSFAQVGGGDFVQPLLPGEAGWPDKKLVLGQAVDCRGNTYTSAVPYKGKDDTQGSADNLSAQGLFNNLGIPGVRCVDLTLSSYAMINYYAKRIFAHPERQLMDLLPQERATFFCLWMGSNDVLGYATGGGTGKKEGMALNDISPPEQFRRNYDTLVSRLTANGAKGVLVTLPDITQIPYFTTLPGKGLELSDAEAGQLNQYYAHTDITFNPGKNYYVIADTTAPGGKRQMEPSEFLLLSTPPDSITCGTWGKTTPIPDKYVLTLTEAGNIRQATTVFNQIITTAAQNHHLALMDADAYLQTIRSGVDEGGRHFDGKYITGGVFSLDGIHLTPQGYALLANRLLATVETFYHARLPRADVNDYKGIE